jgi:hypothetical protein
MSAYLRTVGDVLARATGMTPTQARGTLRLVLRDLGFDAARATRDEWLHACGEPLREALEKRHVECDARGLAQVRAAVIETRDADEDAVDFFRDID